MLSTAFVVIKFLFDLSPITGFSVCSGTAGLLLSSSGYLKTDSKSKKIGGLENIVGFFSLDFIY